MFITYTISISPGHKEMTEILDDDDDYFQDVE